MSSPVLDRQVMFVISRTDETSFRAWRQFHAYYQSHTYHQTMRRFHVSDHDMGRKIAFIESERFQAMLHKTNAHHLTISEKLKAIKYARKYGFVRANNKTNISLGLLTKWVEQYKNNQLGFNPDLQATRQISQISARVNDIQWMLWGDKTKLLQLLDIEDKVYGHPSDWASTKMCYRAIRELHHFKKVPLALLCQILGVSPRGYHNWKNRSCPQLNAWNDGLAQQIRAIHRQYPFYGANRLQWVLQHDFDLKVSAGKIKRYLNELQSPTRYWGSRVNGEHLSAKRIHNRLLKHGRPCFEVQHKNQIWVSDFSMIYKTRTHSVYLLVVLDLYGRFCLAAKPLVFTNTVEKLVKVVAKLFRQEKPQIFHSDQGKEATSFAFNHLLELNGVKQSLSRKGRPRDNSPNESFFSLLKIEINHREIVKTKTEQQVIRIVLRWIRWYNFHRVHSSLVKHHRLMTPNEYRNGRKTKTPKIKRRQSPRLKWFG